MKTSHGDPARSNPRNHHKNAIKDQRPEQPHRGAKKGQLKKGQKTNIPQEPRKRRKLVPLTVGSYLTHGPSNVGANVAYMQIIRSNNNGSNLIELAVIKNKNRPLQVGSGLSDPVPTNAPSKKSCFGFLMGTWRWGSLGWVKDFSPSPSSCPWEVFF